MGKGFWRKLLSGCIILASQSMVQASEPESVPGEYLIQLKPSVLGSTKGIHSMLNGLGASLKRVIPGTDILVVKLNKNHKDSKTIISHFLENDSILYAEPNFIYRIDRTPNDPELDKLWGLINRGQPDSKKVAGVAGVDIGAEKAWDLETGNQDLVVAVIDTGIDYTHKDLQGNIWTNEQELNGKTGVDDDGNGFVDDIYGYDFANKDGDPKDDHGHGTHCAGTIGAKGDDNEGVVGVAWNVKLMGVKFLTKDGSGSLDAAVESIKYATKMGAKIMSNSWGGGGYSEILKKAIEEANEKGIVFAAAAGNHAGNNDKKPTYPASYAVPNVISVAALDNRGSLASFSCYGRQSVHVAAPGVNILSTTPNGYNTWSGTSMATPHVSGVIALLLSQESALTPEEVKNRLVKTSKPLSALKGRTASQGIVDAYLALTNQEAPPDLNDPENWKDFQPLAISSRHPYAHNTNETWEVEVPNAKQMVLLFDKFDTEARYDKVTLVDRSGKRIAEMSGDLGLVWSPIIDGNYVKITFTSDASVNRYGFDLSRVAFRPESNESEKSTPLSHLSKHSAIKKE